MPANGRVAASLGPRDTSSAPNLGFAKGFHRGFGIVTSSRGGEQAFAGVSNRPPRNDFCVAPAMFAGIPKSVAGHTLSRCRGIILVSTTLTFTAYDEHTGIP